MLRVTSLWGTRKSCLPKAGARKGNSPGTSPSLWVGNCQCWRPGEECGSRALESCPGAQPLRASASVGAGRAGLVRDVPAFWERVRASRERTPSQPRTVCLPTAYTTALRFGSAFPSLPRCCRSLCHRHSDSPLTICQLQARCQSVLLKCVLQ